MSKTDNNTLDVGATDDHTMHETDTVLVVDDDAGIRDLLEFKLDGQGFDVVTAANGEDCLKCLREGPLPEVVLLDVMMPYTDGFEVLGRIREEFGSDLPVVLLTGMDSAMAEEASVAATDYIEKPFRVSEVRDCLHSLLDEA